jgi:hypothetical protein
VNNEQRLRFDMAYGVTKLRNIGEQMDKDILDPKRILIWVEQARKTLESVEKTATELRTESPHEKAP